MGTAGNLFATMSRALTLWIESMMKTSIRRSGRTVTSASSPEPPCVKRNVAFHPATCNVCSRACGSNLTSCIKMHRGTSRRPATSFPHPPCRERLQNRFGTQRRKNDEIVILLGRRVWVSRGGNPIFLRGRI